MSTPDLIVIPARHGSSRLPGKPLATIAGHSLLERVAAIGARASAIAGGARLIVATDHKAIAEHAQALGHDAIMTDPEIASGSGRACTVALSFPQPPAIVVNLQGDAPFTPPEVVAQLITVLRQSKADAATAVVRLAWDELDALRAHKRLSPSSGTTCIRAPDGRAIWFSKSIIPAIRDEDDLRASQPRSPILGHLGLYAYRLDALERFEQAPVSVYERIEGLEQLRFLELGLSMLAVEIEPSSHVMAGIDTLEDVAWAETVISEQGDPHDLWGNHGGPAA